MHSRVVLVSRECEDDAVRPLGCIVPCKLSWDQLETRCRQEKVSCKVLGVSKNNLNDYEVEYLCDYKRMKVSAGYGFRPISSPRATPDDWTWVKYLIVSASITFPLSRPAGLEGSGLQFW